jgi:hypothetical protein
MTNGTLMLPPLLLVWPEGPRVQQNLFNFGIKLFFFFKLFLFYL